jgi:hypothetical protein
MSWGPGELVQSHALPLRGGPCLALDARCATLRRKEARQVLQRARRLRVHCWRVVSAARALVWPQEIATVPIRFRGWRGSGQPARERISAARCRPCARTIRAVDVHILAEPFDVRPHVVEGDCQLAVGAPA